MGKICFILFFFSGELFEKLVVVDLFNLLIVEWYEVWYLYGLMFLDFYCSVIYLFIVFVVKLFFLLFMLIFVYCVVGVVWVWIVFYVDILKISLIVDSLVVGVIRCKIIGKKLVKRK